MSEFHVVSALVQKRSEISGQIAELEKRGHELKRLDRQYGNQQVLLWRKDSGQVEAASDPRGVGRSALWK